MLFLCDLDGVIVDLIGGIEELVGCKLKQDWTKGNYDVASELQKHKVDHLFSWDLPVEFWSNLKMTEEADEILRILNEKNVIYVSKYYDESSELGKSIWLNRHGFSKYILTKEPKYKLFNGMKIDTLLIDDSDEEVSGFKNGILIPRPWNSSRMTMEEFIGLLKEVK